MNKPAIKWAYAAFKISVKELKEKYAEFLLFIRTQDKETTERYIV